MTSSASKEIAGMVDDASSDGAPEATPDWFPLLRDMVRNELRVASEKMQEALKEVSRPVPQVGVGRTPSWSRMSLRRGSSQSGLDDVDEDEALSQEGNGAALDSNREGRRSTTMASAQSRCSVSFASRHSEVFFQEEKDSSATLEASWTNLPGNTVFADEQAGDGAVVGGGVRKSKPILASAALRAAEQRKATEVHVGTEEMAKESVPRAISMSESDFALEARKKKRTSKFHIPVLRFNRANHSFYKWRRSFVSKKEPSDGGRLLSTLRIVPAHPPSGDSEGFDHSEEADRPKPSLKMQCSQASMELATTLLTPSERLDFFVRGTWFDGMVAVLIGLNAILLGVEFDYAAQKRTDVMPPFIEVLERVFAAGFVFELSLRIWVFRCKLFTNSMWKWNVFDVILVALQLVEEVLAILENSMGLPSLSFMRVLRVLRLMRLMRVVRIMRLIGELQNLVAAICNSLRALFWTVVLMTTLVYVAALFFTQVTSDYLLENSDSDTSFGPARFFGSIPTSALTLFQAITGGVTWNEVTDTLREDVHWAVSWIFVAYIAFMVLALLNVVTGVFVDAAIHKTKEQADIFMINNVRDIFGDMEHEMTWVEFESKINRPEMVRYFKYLDVDVSDARGLFQLVDVDNSGTIDAEEFLMSCLRLKGPAKALDLQLLMRELNDLTRSFKEQFKVLEKALGLEDRSAGQRTGGGRNGHGRWGFPQSEV